MKFSYALFLLAFFTIACQSNKLDETIFGEELSLGEFDYFEESIPFSKNQYQSLENHDQMAALGRLLFYDVRLSKNNSIACASCHKQGEGFAENKRFSSGLENYQTKRNSMTLVNNVYQISHFWEGHSGKMSDHILNPVSNHIEMGMRSVDDLAEKLSTIDAYNDLFVEVYGDFGGADITESNINQALSAFVASIISHNSKFDKGEENNFMNFSASEHNGKELFFGKARCGSCHKGDHFAASWRRSTNIGLDLVYEDDGAADGHFKVPSLRNIELTSPYMHDGRFETLEEVVDHYTEGVQNHPQLDWILGSDISLEDHEKADLVEFLKTLTDYSIITDEKFSNPF